MEWLKTMGAMAGVGLASILSWALGALALAAYFLVVVGIAAIGVAAIGLVVYWVLSLLA